MRYDTELSSRSRLADPRNPDEPRIPGTARVRRTILGSLFCLSLWLSGGAPEARPQATVHPDLEVYARTPSVVDWSLDDLVKFYPDEMAAIEFDPAQEQLAPLLSRVSDNVGAFFRDFPNTACKESVLQERIRPDGRVEARAQQEFQYLVFVKSPDLAAEWEEDRTDAKGRPVRRAAPGGLSLLTSGYAMAGAYFHPAHRYGSRFRYLGRERANPHAHVIAFAQRPEMQDLLGSFGVHGRAGGTGVNMKSVITMVQGLAWVSAEAGQIVRMRTDLLAPRPDVSLTRQTTDISFSAVEFPNIAQRFWLPEEVVVTMDWNGKTYRNRHRYADYRVFTVQSYQQVDRPAPVKH